MPRHENSACDIARLHTRATREQPAPRCRHGAKRRPWAKIIFAILPTSAASERVFSLLEAMFGKDQDSALAHLIQGALMLSYNKRTVG